MVSGILAEARDAVKRMARFARRRDEGEGYIVYHTATVPANGGSIALHLENPSDRTDIDVQQIIIETQFREQYWIYDVFDGDVTGGTAATIENLRMDSANGPPDSGDMAATKDPTYTADGTHFHGSGGGDSPGGTVGGSGVGVEPLIEPGRQIVVELQNDSANDRVGTVAIVFSEVSQDQIQATL